MTRKTGPVRSLRRAAAPLAAAAFLFGLAGGAAAAPPALPTAEAILAKHAAARGGAEAWAALGSMEWSGTHTNFSTPVPFRMVWGKGGLYRFETVAFGKPMLVVSDGKNLWWNNAAMGTPWPLDIPQPQADITRRDAQLGTTLLSAKARGHKVTVAGQETFEGKKAYRLEVDLADGAKETWYLDAKSHLELMRVSQTTDFGQIAEMKTWYTDFRQVSGLVLPHRIDMEYGTRNEVFEIASVKTGVPLDPASLKKPGPEGMDTLAALEGTWDVAIETRPGPWAPWTKTAGTATIARLLDGALLEERISWMDSGVRQEAVRTYAWDRFRKTYRMTQTDNFSGHTNIYEGQLADGKLSLSNEKTGTWTLLDERQLWNRLAVTGITPKEFKVASESSMDQGKRWTNDTNMTYTRK